MRRVVFPAALGLQRAVIFPSLALGKRTRNLDISTININLFDFKHGVLSKVGLDHLILNDFLG
jgi:hypothetical protein